MAHCEDASCVDRLTHLDSVGTKLAPVIFDLPSTSGIKEFMHKCQQISIRKEESLQLIDNLVSLILFLIIMLLLNYCELQLLHICIL